MLKGDLSSFSLGEIFQSLAINNHTGTLKILSRDQGEKLIFFSQGEISLFSHGSAGGLRIGDVLVRMGKVSAADLEEALQEQRRTKGLLGQILITKGLVAEGDVRDALRTKIREEIYDLFMWTEGSFEFHMGSCPEDLFDELQRSLTVTINTNGVIMEGLRRLDEWSLIKKRLKTLDEIFARTEIPATGLAEIEKEVLAQFDGVRSVRDSLKGFYGTRFEFCQILCNLWDKGHVRPLSLEECKAGAEAARAKKRFPWVVGFLKHATQLEPAEPELFEALAEACAGALEDGPSRSAYLQAVRLYDERGNIQKAAQTAEKLLPGSDLETRDLEICFRAFCHVENVKKALSTGGQLAAALQKEGEVQRAAEVLQSISRIDPSDLNLKIQIAGLLEKAGEVGKAKEHLEEVAGVLEPQKKYRELLKVLRLLHSLQPEESEIKEKITALQALIERLERRRKRRLTVAGAATVVLLVLSVAPMLYEMKAREHFTHARSLEDLASGAESFDRAKHAYGELIEKYGFSTKVAEAQSALARLQTIEDQRSREREREARTAAEFRERSVEEAKAAFESTLAAARSAEERGEIREAHGLYSKLLSEYTSFPATRDIRLPVRITSTPSGAALVVNEVEVGKTPHVHHYVAGTTVELQLTRSSCDKLAHKVELEDQWELHFTLTRRPVSELTFGGTVQQPMASSPPLVVLPARDGKVYAFDPVRADIVWEREVGRYGDRLSDLGAGGGEVYLATVSGEVTAVNARNGQSRWVTSTDGPIVAAPAVSTDGRVVAAGTLAGSVFLIDNASGKAFARIVTENEVVASPLFVGEILVAGSRDNSLYGYSLTRKEHVFVWELGDDVLAMVAVDADTILAVTADAALHCLALSGTRVLWSRSFPAVPCLSIVSTPAGIHVGTRAGEVVTLSPSTGEVAWRVAVGPAAVGGLTASGNEVFAGLENGELVSIGLREKEVAWRYRTGSPLAAPPAVVDGMLCVGGVSGKVWLFEVLE
jgi:outer membrane protein assembly factor BamB/tetratricopeptide (TPR) repeat protein